MELNLTRILNFTAGLIVRKNIQAGSLCEKLGCSLKSGNVHVGLKDAESLFLTVKFYIFF